MGGNKVFLFLLITVLNNVPLAHQAGHKKLALRNDVDIQENYASDGTENDNSTINENNKESASSTSAESLPSPEKLIVEDSKERPLTVGVSSTSAESLPPPEKLNVEDSKERPLTVGDIFTTSELLPVAEKLISKVENPGMGKGIVSSSKSPQHLADKLFEQFFLTNKRIVTLTAFDISGLDALQALALSGEVADLRSYIDSTVEPFTMIDYKGQNIAVNTEPKKSKYRLLLKNGKPKLKKKIVFQNRSEDLVKKAKARNLLKIAMKAIRESKNGTHKKGPIKINVLNRLKENNTQIYIKGKPNGPHKTKQTTKESKADVPNPEKEENHRPLCTWRYVCSDPSELDSCKLRTECNKQYRKHAKRDAIDALGIPHRSDEHSRDIQQFRKMIGITLVDEEVEKILEMRVINLRPSKRGQELERLESLAEYFNNIVMAEALKRESTTPYYEESTYPMGSESGKTLKREVVELRVSSDEDNPYSDSVRRILKKPARKVNTTPKGTVT